MSGSFAGAGDFYAEPPITSTAILEGFLCPICKADLKTPDLLMAHVQAEHTEQDQDLIRSFRGMLQSAKQKIRQEFAGNQQSAAAASGSGAHESGSPASSSSSSSGAAASNAALTGTHTSAYPPLFSEAAQQQQIGADMSHTAHFRSVRSPRLERYATETNKLLIRLHKLLSARPTDRAERKLAEQRLVPWMDGRLVKLCPGCAAKFFLTRRQHHCRLCGSIMCQECSRFLDIAVARQLVLPVATTPEEEEVGRQQQQRQGDGGLPAADEEDGGKLEDRTLRVCGHCLHLLETRQDMQDARTFRPPICALYERLERMRQEVLPDCGAYERVVASLMAGDTIFTLADAGALRARIGRVAEEMDAVSKAVLQLQAVRGSQAERLQRFVRLGAVQYIKEEMLVLAPLPAEEEVERRQLRRREEAERRVERERRMALERWEARRAEAVARGEVGELAEGQRAAASVGQGQRQNGGRDGGSSVVHSLDAWHSGQQATTVGQVDVLVEQINNIKGFIRQAREAMRFEEVEILELNLRELQQEFYERQLAEDADDD